MLPPLAGSSEYPSRWVSDDTCLWLVRCGCRRCSTTRARCSTSAVWSPPAQPRCCCSSGRGSAAQVYRPRLGGSRFLTTSTMSVPLGLAYLGDHRSSCTRFRPLRGSTATRPPRLISAVPPPPAAAGPRRPDHAQADGKPSCTYHVTWSRPLDPRVSGRRLRIAALRLEAVRPPAPSADLVASDDVAKVLQRITERAAASVLAQGYLLAPDGGPARRWRGRRHPRRRGGRAWPRAACRRPPRPSAVVVDIVFSPLIFGWRRLPRRSAGPCTNQRRLLAAYASRAAAALDLLTALEDSRRDGARSAPPAVPSAPAWPA